MLWPFRQRLWQYSSTMYTWLIILIKTWSQTEQIWPCSKTWRCDFENSTVRRSAIFKSNNAKHPYKAILFIIRLTLLQDDNISIKWLRLCILKVYTVIHTYEYFIFFNIRHTSKSKTEEKLKKKLEKEINDFLLIRSTSRFWTLNAVLLDYYQSRYTRSKAILDYVTSCLRMRLGKE